MGELDGYNVLFLNAPKHWASDACNIMAKNKPFSVCFWDDGFYRNFNLRSNENGGIDVSKIASKYNGGGHKHSAGFRLKL